MDHSWIGIIGFGVLVTLILIGFEVAAAMMIVGFVGTLYLIGLKGALGILSIVPYAQVANYAYIVMPMFLFMGCIIFHTGISESLYRAAHKWLGHLPGGLGIATIAATGVLSAISSSSLATAATMGKVALPEMERYKYNKSLATGLIAAGATVDIMIPPSAIFIVYGFLTEQSIGKLFMAGFVPGFILVVLYSIVIFIITKYKPSYAPKAERAPFKEKVVSLGGIWPVVALFIAVIVGMYAGFVSAIEAGALGAFIALVISLVMGWFSKKRFFSGISDAVSTSAMILFILLGAMIFSSFITLTRLPYNLAELIIATGFSRYYVLLCMIAVYVFLGCMLDDFAIILITTPIFAPIVSTLGFDLIWFGVVVVMVTQIAMITPPFGLSVFVLQSVAKDVPLQDIFRGTLPFLAADFLTLAVIVAFPQLSLFLPNLMK